MRTGELQIFKIPLHSTLNQQIMNKMISHGLKRKNYKLFVNLFSKLRVETKDSKNFLNDFISIFDKLVLRIDLLEITQRGKKVSIPLPTSNEAAVSTFVSTLIKLIRKNNILHKDIPNYIFNLFTAAKNKQGILYTNKLEAYRIAKQNSFAMKRLYIIKNNKKKAIKKNVG